MVQTSYSMGEMKKGHLTKKQTNKKMGINGRISTVFHTKHGLYLEVSKKRYNSKHDDKEAKDNDINS